MGKIIGILVIVVMTVIGLNHFGLMDAPNMAKAEKTGHILVKDLKTGVKAVKKTYKTVKNVEVNVKK